jgi:hypothetical protein
MKEQIKKLAEQADFIYTKKVDAYLFHIHKLERFAELVRQNEREACAQVSDEFDDDVGQAISRAIRARGVE